MGIKYLVLTGVVSDMCVMGTARTAAELGYYTLICEDACAAYTQRIHTESMLMHARKFGRVAQCQDIIAELEQSRKVTVHTPCKRKIGDAPSGGFSLFSGFPRPKLLLP